MINSKANLCLKSCCVLRFLLVGESINMLQLITSHIIIDFCSHLNERDHVRCSCWIMHAIEWNANRIYQREEVMEWNGKQRDDERIFFNILLYITLKVSYLEKKKHETQLYKKI